MFFTESHEWIKVEGLIGTVGISRHAQKELGEIVFIELPKVGSTVKAKEEICVLESTKAAADVYAPVSGEIIAVNAALKEDLSQINIGAESTGWLFQIALSNPDELKTLMSEQEYHSLVG